MLRYTTLRRAYQPMLSGLVFKGISVLQGGEASNENELTGNIPKELGNLKKLGWLSLRYNNLSGNIPKELGSLESLDGLNVYDNQLSGNIPKELENLKNIERIILNDNRLVGDVPKEFRNFDKLDFLDLVITHIFYVNCIRNCKI